MSAIDKVIKALKSSTHKQNERFALDGSSTAIERIHTTKWERQQQHTETNSPSSSFLRVFAVSQCDNNTIVGKGTKQTSPMAQQDQIKQVKPIEMDNKRDEQTNQLKWKSERNRARNKVTNQWEINACCHAVKRTRANGNKQKLAQPDHRNDIDTYRAASILAVFN